MGKHDYSIPVAVRYSILLNLADIIYLQPNDRFNFQLKDSLSNVPMIPPKNARSVLRAVVPVMRYDTSLRDAAILTFRKSLFSKNPDSRRIAVFGLTEMMKKFKVRIDYNVAFSFIIVLSSFFALRQMQVFLM